MIEPQAGFNGRVLVSTAHFFCCQLDETCFGDDILKVFTLPETNISTETIVYSPLEICPYDPWKFGDSYWKPETIIFSARFDVSFRESESCPNNLEKKKIYIYIYSSRCSNHFLCKDLIELIHLKQPLINGWPTVWKNCSILETVDVTSFTQVSKVEAMESWTSEMIIPVKPTKKPLGGDSLKVPQSSLGILRVLEFYI